MTTITLTDEEALTIRDALTDVPYRSEGFYARRSAILDKLRAAA